MKLALGLLTSVLLSIPGTLDAQSNALIGTWKLNVSKSTLEGRPVRSRINTYTANGPNIKNLQESIDADGKPNHAESTSAYDGKEYPVTDNVLVDSVVNRRVDTNSFIRIQTKNKRIVNFLERVVSADGKTLTVRQIGIDADGKAYSRVEVYDKQ